MSPLWPPEKRESIRLEVYVVNRRLACHVLFRWQSLSFVSAFLCGSIAFRRSISQDPFILLQRRPAKSIGHRTIFGPAIVGHR
jgi:hypothetical protein